MAAMARIGDAEFDREVMRSDKLTLVDFGAEWCGPCKKLHPIMNELAGEYGDKLKVVEVDVGMSPQVAMKFGVTSVPQLMFVNNGVVRETVVGLLPKSKIQDKIDRYLR
jgi:thioredoxin 1